MPAVNSGFGGNTMLRSILAITLLVAAVCAKADVVGIYGGVGYWRANFSGDVISNVDVEDELGISGDNSLDLWVGIEHPIPLLPNIRLERTPLKDSGSGTVKRDFDYQGQTFTVNEQVTTDVDLTHTDATFYYEILDTGMDLDVGLTGRWFGGEVQVNDAREDLNILLPMLYVRGKFYLPFSGLYIGAKANGISYKSSRATDFALKLGWETDSFIFPEFGVEGGYRRFNIRADEDDADIDVDVDMDGVFVNLTAHF